ncbi:hypothetical protein DENSPDRAFT_838389 [Dentipellis sp. KUC8613]|nr:hypothetical protein DENSPDRAFT_838389 [Dentipellis sp. KUC8613]
MTSGPRQLLHRDDELWEEFHALFPGWVKQRQIERTALLSYILIFIGLFTGVTSSFLLSSMTFLQSNPVDATNELLRFAILQLVNSSEAASVPNDFTLPSPKPQKVAIIATYTFSVALVSSLVASILDIYLLASVSSMNPGALYHGPEDRRKAWQSLCDPDNAAHATIRRTGLALSPLYIIFVTVILFIIGYIPYLHLQGGSSLALTAIPFAYLLAPGVMAAMIDFSILLVLNLAVNDSFDPQALITWIKRSDRASKNEYTVDVECLCWVLEHTSRPEILLRAMNHIGATTDSTLLQHISTCKGARRLDALLSGALHQARMKLDSTRGSQGERTTEDEDLKTSLRSYLKVIAHLLAHTRDNANLLKIGREVAEHSSPGWRILANGDFSNSNSDEVVFLHPDFIACGIVTSHSPFRGVLSKAGQLRDILRHPLPRTAQFTPANIHGISLIAWAVGNLPNQNSDIYLLSLEAVLSLPGFASNPFLERVKTMDMLQERVSMRRSFLRTYLR